MKTPSTTQVHVLIGKSIIETLLVGGLAVFTFIAVLPPYFHGWGEATEQGIAGWAVNDASPWERVEVQLFVDGKFLASSVANESRPDVREAGWAKDEWHGYNFPLALPAGHYYEARVYALHGNNRLRKSLQQLGDPIFFVVSQDGKLVKAKSEAP